MTTPEAAPKLVKARVTSTTKVFRRRDNHLEFSHSKPGNGGTRRWENRFTRSLKKDGQHFIAHAGTAMAVMALSSCEETNGFSE